MKIYIFKSALNGEWYFHVKQKNGRITLQSEGYKRKASIVKLIASLKVGLPKATIIYG